MEMRLVVKREEGGGGGGYTSCRNVTVEQNRTFGSYRLLLFVIFQNKINVAGPIVPRENA